MDFNQRKADTLEYFSRREWVRPAQYAIDSRFHPIRASYSYLLHLHRMGYLVTGDDATGHRVYKLSRRGASWLLRFTKQE